jgi:serine/threonine-protein kinase
MIPARSLHEVPTSLPTGDLQPDAAAQDEFLSPGTAVGQYSIQEALGEGGCGIVYAAKARNGANRVAIKVLRGSLAGEPKFLARFEREVRALKLILHPNIVQMEDLGELADGRPYYVMELVQGTTLSALLRERGSLPPKEVLELLSPICGAVHAAHTAGFIHRDIKASNIIVALADSERTVKLLDFGIAKIMETDPGESTLTTMGRRLGTPIAMAPEQILGGAVDARVDVYALGVLLYQMLTGELPFRSKNNEALELESMHLRAPVPRPSDAAPVAPAWDEVVLKAMHKLPERRYPSVSAFLEAVRNAIAVGPRPEVSARFALAISISAQVNEDDIDEVDRIMTLLDDAEQVVAENELTAALRLATSLLCVRVFAQDEQAECRTLVSQLATRLDEPFRAACLPVSVCIHCEDVAYGIGGQAETSGIISGVSRWAAGFHPGVALTPEAKARLGGG